MEVGIVLEDMLGVGGEEEVVIPVAVEGEVTMVLRLILSRKLEGTIKKHHLSAAEVLYTFLVFLDFVTPFMVFSVVFT